MGHFVRCLTVITTNTNTTKSHTMYILMTFFYSVNEIIIKKFGVISLPPTAQFLGICKYEYFAFHF
jgi:hypothetical protein